MNRAEHRQLQPLIDLMKVLLVDDEPNMRKVVRTMLFGVGIKKIFEAEDAMSGLNMIRLHHPTLVIVDWEMPDVDGAQFIKMVRSPKTFPYPDVPIIILSGHSDQWRVVEAGRVGAHEYLLKPVSTQALMSRLAAIFLQPRPMIKTAEYYGPAPRRMTAYDERFAPLDYHSDTDIRL
jgi:two-component system, chemotaxis family, chemotaxis protein CheY